MTEKLLHNKFTFVFPRIMRMILDNENDLLLRMFGWEDDCKSKLSFLRKTQNFKLIPSNDNFFGT